MWDPLAQVCARSRSLAYGIVIKTATEVIERLSGGGIVHLAVTWYSPFAQVLPHGKGQLLPSPPIVKLVDVMGLLPRPVRRAVSVHVADGRDCTTNVASLPCAVGGVA